MKINNPFRAVPATAQKSRSGLFRLRNTADCTEMISDIHCTEMISVMMVFILYISVKILGTGQY